MSLQIENLEKNMAKLTIEVPAEEFEAAMQKSYNNQKGKISIPGFRKGKVPYAYLLKAYGPEMFYEEAANIVMPEAYAKATSSDECTLDIVSRPLVIFLILSCKLFISNLPNLTSKSKDFLSYSLIKLFNVFLALSSLALTSTSIFNSSDI